jgi:hypothetical protein
MEIVSLPPPPKAEISSTDLDPMLTPCAFHPEPDVADGIAKVGDEDLVTRRVERISPLGVEDCVVVVAGVDGHVGHVELVESSHPAAVPGDMAGAIVEDVNGGTLVIPGVDNQVVIVRDEVHEGKQRALLQCLKARSKATRTRVHDGTP